MSKDLVPDPSIATSPPRCQVEYETIEKADEVIGRGGQAVVHKAEVGDQYPMKRVAIKEPLAPDTLTRDTIDEFLDKASTWEMVDRREREKQRWADSDHIVGVVDTGDRLPWIAMEYMDGGGLDNRLESEQDGLPTDEALWISECLCRGVEVAHSYGIAHLDLKPANVLFRETPDGVWDVPKVADWGLARVLAEQSETMECLSVSYAAPEQFAPEEFGDPDTLTDVYQLGAILYAMLTGEPPYTGSQLKVMHSVTNKTLPQYPSDLRSELSKPIDGTVLTALAPDKTERFDSVHSFKRTVQAIRHGQRMPQVIHQWIQEHERNWPQPANESTNFKEAERFRHDEDTSEEVNVMPDSSQTNTRRSSREKQSAQDPDELDRELKKGDVIELEYTARTVEKETLVDTTDPETAGEADAENPQYSFGPQIVPLGKGRLSKSVEQDVIGRTVGESGSVVVPAEEAFGEHDPDDVRTISADKIPEDDRYSGAHADIDGEYGHVEAVIGGRARVDFNHPLAGDDIKYEYKIVEYVGDQSEIDLEYDQRIVDAITAHISGNNSINQPLHCLQSNLENTPLTREVAPMRTPVEGVHSVSDLGTVVTGTIRTGQMSQGDKVVFQPSDVQGEIETIESHHGEISKATFGDSVRFAIQGVTEEEIRRGDVCGPANNPPIAAEAFKARIVVADHPSVITAGYTPVFHVHTAQTACTIDSIDKKIDPSSGEVVDNYPDFIQSGDAAIVSVRPQKPLGIAPVSDIPELGSFTVRDMGQTIAVGRVDELKQKL